MFDHQYYIWVALTIFLISLFSGGYLCCKFNLDDLLLLVTIASVILGIVGGALLCPDKRTPTEKFNDRLSEYNMIIDNMVYIDEGKVFKFDNTYFLRTSDGSIILLDTSNALAVYDK